MPLEYTSQSEAQARADRINAFNTELETLQQTQVVSMSESQQRSIAEYHQSVLARLKEQFDIDHSNASKQLSLGMKIVSLVCALAMASAVFFVFFQFWGHVNTFTQSAILVTSSVLSFIAVYVTAIRDKSGYYTKIIWLISYACLVLNLVMFGQMFSITPSPNAFLIWALYAFLLAYLCKARVLLVLAILNLSSFLSMYMSTWSGVYFISFGEHPENIMVASLFIFSIPFVLHLLKNQSVPFGLGGKFNTLNNVEHFNKVYRVMGLILFFLPVLILSNWGGGSYIDLAPNAIEGIYQTVGFIVAGLTIYLGIKIEWRHVNITGNIFFVLFLYTKFFDWW